MSAQQPFLDHGNQHVPRVEGNRDAPLFPLDEEVMLEVAQPVSAAALVVLSTCLVVAGTGLGEEKTKSHVVVALNSILFTYIPIGLAGLFFSAAAKKRPQLVGLASGFLLADFLIPVLIGAVVTVEKSGATPWDVAVVTCVILVAIVIAWSFLCSYPKFLRCGRDRASANANAQVTTSKCATCSGDVDQDTGKSLVQAEGLDQCPTCEGPAMRV